MIVADMAQPTGAISFGKAYCEPSAALKRKRFGKGQSLYCISQQTYVKAGSVNPA